MQAVVLAGGLATRMLPQTERVPKSLLQVAGRPFVDWQLELLARSGIRDVVLCIAHLGELIRAHVGDGARHGLSVRYAEEEPGRLLGTAGALRAAVPLLAPRFLVTYGDSYLRFDYAEPLRVLEQYPDSDG
jgi:NDP-sugar pyrophosphorylase family protein